MMKKQLTFLVAMLLTTAGFAQPILDKLYDFQPGVSYTYKILTTSTNIDTNSIATVGQNVSWDFSSYNLDPTIFTDSIKTLAGSSFPAAFVGATYVFKEHSGLQQYYRKSGDSILYMGNDYGGRVNRFLPDALTIILPGTYAATGNNNYGPMSVNAAGPTWIYTGRYNAVGSLKLPGGATFQNVGLYIVRGGDASQTYSDYMWARAGDAQPLMRIQFRITPGSCQVYHSYFPTSSLNPTSVVHNAAGNSALTLYPNPTTKALHFKGTTTPRIVAVTDMAGKKVDLAKYESGSNVVNVAALSPGLYLLTVTTDTDQSSAIFRIAN